VIVFSRVRAGSGGVVINYMVAQDGSFGSPVLVPGVSTTDGNSTADAWVSPDGCRIYVSSDRSGNYDLYMATAQ
jgi:Tol biopolymer transport system component